MGNEVIVRRPKYGEAEIRAFVEVVVKGKEVEAQDIERGANRAAALIWISGESGPIAVAALKNPFEIYKRGVFRKAGVSPRHQEFTSELGYIYVTEAHRG